MGFTNETSQKVIFNLFKIYIAIVSTAKRGDGGVSIPYQGLMYEPVNGGTKVIWFAFDARSVPPGASRDFEPNADFMMNCVSVF